MIPIRDNVQSNRTPFVTLGFIALNAGIFAICAMMSEPELERFIFHYGFIPAKLFQPDKVQAFYARHFGISVPDHYGLVESLFPLLTSMFLHGGWLHVIGNMWILWIFGDNVEDRLGHLGFLGFYVGCGLLSGIAHGLSAPGSPVPTVGASGAIAGVMGAYLVLYPRARVLTLLPIFILIYFIELPALVFLFYWFAIQILSGVASLVPASAGGAEVGMGGVAWWAHIGGFVVGAGFVFLAGIRGYSRAERRYSRTRYTVDPWSRRNRRGPFD